MNQLEPPNVANVVTDQEPKAVFAAYWQRWLALVSSAVNALVNAVAALQTSMTAVQASVTELSGQLVGIPSAAPIRKVVLMNVAVTPVAAPAADTEAVECFLTLIQDAVGGRAFTLGPGFYAAAVALDTTANTVSVLHFVRETINGTLVWAMAGQPTTGMSAS